MNSMRPIRETISLEAARELIDGAVRPIERTERVRIDSADGRVVARPVDAQADVPPFTRAAMDGYAVRAADTIGASTHDPRTLAWVETVFTGQLPTRPVGPQQCTEIATGAPVPAGSDAVVMVEETETAAPTDGARVRPGLSGSERHQARSRYPGRPAGAASQATCSIRAASALLPRSACVEVEVYARPRVAILSTGNEVVDPGQPLEPGHIYDINKFTLSAVLREHGAVPGALSDGARHRAGADTRPRGLPRRGRRPLLGRQFRRRARSHPRRRRAHGRGAVSRHRRQARQADAVRHYQGYAGLRHARLSHLVPVERLHAAHRAAAAGSPACRSGRRESSASRSASASCRPRGGTSSTRCGSWTGRRCPHSRRRATSRACRRPTATSRSRRRSMSSKRVNPSTSDSSEESGGSRQTGSRDARFRKHDARSRRPRAAVHPAEPERRARVPEGAPRERARPARDFTGAHGDPTAVAGSATWPPTRRSTGASGPRSWPSWRNAPKR